MGEIKEIIEEIKFKVSTLIDEIKKTTSGNVAHHICNAAIALTSIQFKIEELEEELIKNNIK